MSTRVPLLPTLVVAAAVAAMIGLGIWQLERRATKEAMIARYAAAQALSSAVEWPRDAKARERALFRHSELRCERVLGQGALSGRSSGGEPGWAHTARCALDGGGEAEVVLGWSREPGSPSWSGGEVLGLVAPAGPDGARLIASPPLAGLAANAPPDPDEVPNNHLAYAVQWFIFAVTAATIYALALRRRGPPG